MTLLRAITIARRAMVAQYDLKIDHHNGEVVIAACDPANKAKAAAYAKLGRLQTFIANLMREES